jgi:hypothetical protein
MTLVPNSSGQRPAGLGINNVDAPRCQGTVRVLSTEQMINYVVYTCGIRQSSTHFIGIDSEYQQPSHFIATH